MPIKWKSKILLGKIEATYGTDSAPVGANDGILATNVVLTPMDGQDISRELELPWLAAQATVAAELSTRLQYRVEMVPSGTAGTAPAWAPCLIGCGIAEVVTAGTSVAYSPISEDEDSLTHHLWVGGTRYVLKGSRGTAVMRFNAQGLPYLECDYRGLFSLPSEQARPTVDLTAFLAPEVVSAANTPEFKVATKALTMRSFSLNIGNDVQGRFLVPSESIQIVDRADAAEFQVEAVPLTTWDPYAAAADPATRAAISLKHGNTAGRKLALALQSTQIKRPGELVNQQNIVEWRIGATPLPVAGNDQWTLTLT